MLSDDIEAGEAECAIAAAEVVAYLGKHPMANLPEEIEEGVSLETVPLAHTITAALNAVTAIRERSELRELWDEDGSGDGWLAEVDDLLGRLRASVQS